MSQGNWIKAPWVNNCTHDLAFLTYKDMLISFIILSLVYLKSSILEEAKILIKSRLNYYSIVWILELCGVRLW